MTVYYLGGGTCCGKSTIASLLCERYGFTLYKLDDYLYPYLERMSSAGSQLAADSLSMDNEQAWMRDIQVQLDEELALYQGMYPYARSALADHPEDTPIVAEGAGFLPSLVHRDGIAPNRYLCLAPTERFQLDQYSQRPWITQYLSNTSDPQLAFSNWMKRDQLFSQAVMAEAQTLGYPTRLVDGTASIEENLAWVERQLELK